MIQDGSWWRNETPARSLMSLAGFRPFRFIKDIKCRGLVIYGEKDSLTDIKKVKKNFSGNPQYEMLELPCGHFDLFQGENFRQALAAQVRFLRSIF